MKVGLSNHQSVYVVVYDTFWVTSLYNADDRVTSEWLWWIKEDKHPYLKLDSNHGLSIQAINTYNSECVEI
jgi:hypothetical protein